MPSDASPLVAGLNQSDRHRPVGGFNRIELDFLSNTLKGRGAGFSGTLEHPARTTNGTTIKDDALGALGSADSFKSTTAVLNLLRSKRLAPLNRLRVL